MVKSHNWLQLLRFLVFGLLLLFGVVTFSVSYSAGTAVLTGVILALLARALYRLISKKFLELLIKGGLALLLVLLCSIVFITTIWSEIHPYLLLLSPTPRICVLESYKATVMAGDTSLNTLSIRDEIVFNPTVLQHTTLTPPTTWDIVVTNEGQAFRLPERQILGGNRGFLLKQADFDLPYKDVFSSARFSPDLEYDEYNGSLVYRLEDYYVLPCMQRDTTNVTLKDFPRGAFFAAKDATDVNTQSYIDEDTITWSTGAEHVTFAYVPPPFNHIYPLLNPLVGISSLNEFVDVIIAIVITFIVTNVIRPGLIEMAQNRFKSLGKRPENEPSKKTILIVSSKGDEKEIEVKEK